MTMLYVNLKLQKEELLEGVKKYSFGSGLSSFSYFVSLNELLHTISANIVLSLGKLLRKSPTVPVVLISDLDELVSSSLVHVPFSYKTA